MGDELQQIQNLKKEFERSLENNQVAPWELQKDKRLTQIVGDWQQKTTQEKRILGKALNELRSFLKQKTREAQAKQKAAGFQGYLDVTAPWGLNQNKKPNLIAAEEGSIHPTCKALDAFLKIFSSMGFTAIEGRQLDNDFYMFDSLNFPKEHPVRDDFDTFFLTEKDANGLPLLAPAHVSAMQNRALRAGLADLQAGRAIATVLPGRVFRNEDVDARHDHMFYQIEGVYVDRQVSVSNLIATLQAAFSAYYQTDIELKIQPAYFSFTEPSFEFAASCVFCSQNAQDCRVCGGAGWIELLGCGMIHPNVLSQGGVDPKRFTGFAWGMGVNRLVMLKDAIEDIRHLTSGKLEFLKQFKYED